MKRSREVRLPSTSSSHAPRTGLWLVLAFALSLPSCTIVQKRIDPVSREEIRQLQNLETKHTDFGADYLRKADNKESPASEKLAALLEAAKRSSPFEKSSRKVSAEESAEKTLIYTAAVRRIVQLLQENNFALSPAAQGDVRNFKIVRSGKNIVDPAAPDLLVPADQIRIAGLRSRTIKPGVGLPFVAWFKRDSPTLANEAGIPPGGMAIPATAILTFTGPAGAQTASLTLLRTLPQETVQVAGKQYPLAADYSAAVAYIIASGRNRSLDIRAMFLSDTHLDQTGLFQFQPYDPNKIPVVFVHGLMSRPETWTHSLNELLADPEVRRKYQFWFYLYPTGLPVWASAYGLRTELDRFNQVLGPRARTAGKSATLNSKVLIGHSMGGLISSLQIRTGGDYLWNQFFEAKLEDIDLSPRLRTQMRNLVYFNSRDDISSSIFVATPHRGSPLALRPLAGFFASFIRLPFPELQSERRNLIAMMKEDARQTLSAPANSIRFLRAKSPLLLTILTLPRDHNIAIHSIIGDRGRGDTPDSSDGVVPYWSSHLPEAESEYIVPSAHGANENEAAIQEIARILKSYR